MLILITGGAASGKSYLAERLCMRLKNDRLYYIATMNAVDEESTARIERHRKMRFGKGFETIECTQRLQLCAEKLDGGCALLDCLGNLLANEQFGENGIGAKKRTERGVFALYERLNSLVIVSNEVFTSGEEYSAECDKYIKNLAYLHRRIAERADIAVEMCAGIPIVHKGKELFNEINA